MDEHLQTIQQIQRSLIDLAIKFGPKVLVAIIIMVVGVQAGRWGGRTVLRAIAKFDLEPPVRMLLARISSGFIVGLFAIMALQNLGVELLPLLAGLGVAGAGIALAMQGVLGNIVAGLTIIFTRPYKVGEYISIVGEEGGVESISLFNTILLHADRSQVVIPNRKIVGEILHNYGKIRQVDVRVGVAYQTDIKRALGVVERVLRANARVLPEPSPQFHVHTLGESAMHISVNPWVKVPDFSPAINFESG